MRLTGIYAVLNFLVAVIYGLMNTSSSDALYYLPWLLLSAAWWSYEMVLAEWKG